MDDYYLKDETYKIIGLCMEIHKILGKGHSEVVYKDALEYEFKMNSIPYQREKEYRIEYKDIILPRNYFADFVVYDEIILEAPESLAQWSANLLEEKMTEAAKIYIKTVPIVVDVHISDFWNK